MIENVDLKLFTALSVNISAHVYDTDKHGNGMQEATLTDS